MNDPNRKLKEEETDLEQSLLLSVLSRTGENHSRLWGQFCRCVDS